MSTHHRSRTGTETRRCAQALELTVIAQSRSLPAGYVFRAKLILALAEGWSYQQIKQRLQTTAPTISRWKERFLAAGIDGLDTYHPGQKPSVLTPDDEPAVGRFLSLKGIPITLTGLTFVDAWHNIRAE